MTEKIRMAGIIGAGTVGLEVLGLIHRDKTLEVSFLKGDLQKYRYPGKDRGCKICCPYA